LLELRITTRHWTAQTV